MSYNTVLPSSLLEIPNADYYSAHNHVFNNVKLRLGIIKRKIVPSDPSNQGGGVEYDVIVFQQDDDKGMSHITYKNCVTMDSFGGVSDFFEFIKNSPTKDTLDLSEDDGSYVLLLCIDGKASRGIIIGALPHHNRKSVFKNKDIKKDDKILDSEYNGVRFTINPNGELIISVKGSTDNKGKVKGKELKSEISVNKEGSIGVINDGGSVYIDQPKKSVSILSNGDFIVDASKDVKVKGAKGSFDLSELTAKCSGNVSFDCSKLEAKCQEISIKGSNAKIEAESLEIMSSNVNIKSSSIQLGNGGSPAVTMMTQFMGIGNLGAPVMCSAMGPFSGSVFIAS